ncbi:MAG: trans-sulfuration enzyme family protein [Luteibaculaceae bacterium]
MTSKFSWWDSWLEKKRLYAKTTEKQLNEDDFHTICTGIGLPDICQRSTFSFHTVKEGADRFLGYSQSGEKPYARIYTRLGNPNTEYLEKVLFKLECNHIIEAALANDEQEPTIGCLVSASGMGSISTVITALVKPGDAILAGNIYGCSDSYLNYLSKFGVKRIFCDTTNLEAVKETLEKHPEIVGLLIETPVNPTLEIADIEALSKITEHHGVVLMVDNTFCSPYLQQPFRLGADVVFHSLTKYVNGHSASIAGAALGPFQFFKEEVYRVYKDFGPTPSPFESWLNSLTIQDLGHRVAQQSETAFKLAQFLESHPAVEKVVYPGLKNHPQHEIAKKQMRNFGAMISFHVKGGYDAGVALMNYFARPDTPMELAVSLGSVISYIQHPASMTHSVVPEIDRAHRGITDSLIRFSVGAEGFTNLKNALNEGLSLAVPA